jgi:hypothetical protein
MRGREKRRVRRAENEKGSIYLKIARRFCFSSLFLFE